MNKVRKQEVLRLVAVKRRLWQTFTQRKATLVGHILRHPILVNLIIEERVETEN